MHHFQLRDPHLRSHPGYSGLVGICLQGSVVIMLDGRKQHFSEMFEIISPNYCLHPREEAMYCYSAYTTDPYKGLCPAHGTYTNEGLHLPLQRCLSDFLTQTSEMLPKGTPGKLETEMRLKSNYFCHITFRTNRPSLQTCIRCKSVCKHCSSHHATPCQKVKLLFRIRCSKICWVPESLNLEPKFRDTSSTGTPHMREEP